jgi:hypothetical protein
MSAPLSVAWSSDHCSAHGLIGRTLNVNHELNAALCRCEITSIAELVCRFQQHLDIVFAEPSLSV